MKKSLLILSVLVAFTTTSLFAQCGKTVIWTAPKAEFMDEAGNIQDTKEVNVIIKTTNKEITIVHSDDVNDTLKGTVKEDTCDWKEPFKNGKTILKADLADHGGKYENSTITIEAKESKISISIQMETPDGKKLVIRIPVESYKEEA